MHRVAQGPDSLVCVHTVAQQCTQHTMHTTLFKTRWSSHASGCPLTFKCRTWHLCTHTNTHAYVHTCVRAHTHTYTSQIGVHLLQWLLENKSKSALARFLDHLIAVEKQGALSRKHQDGYCHDNTPLTVLSNVEIQSQRTFLTLFSFHHWLP